MPTWSAKLSLDICSSALSLSCWKRSGQRRKSGKGWFSRTHEDCAALKSVKGVQFALGCGAGTDVDARTGPKPKDKLEVRLLLADVDNVLRPQSNTLDAAGGRVLIKGGAGDTQRQDASNSNGGSLGCVPLRFGATRGSGRSGSRDLSNA